VGGAAGATVPGVEIPAGDVKDCVGIQVVLSSPEILERDALRVPQQPGRLVVEGGAPLLEPADAE
jgi:hypothetical protein